MACVRRTLVTAARTHGHQHQAAAHRKSITFALYIFFFFFFFFFSGWVQSRFKERKHRAE